MALSAATPASGNRIIPQYDGHLSVPSNPSWNLETAMADDAIHYIKQLKEIAPDKPWFVYYVPGATHAPHHPTPEWIEKISEMHLFDVGWNKVRETIFANQSGWALCRERQVDAVAGG